MAHWYCKDGSRFAPIKKDGTPYKTITQKMAKEAGAVRGVTDILRYLGDKGWMKRYFSQMMLDASIYTHDPSISDEIWRLRAQKEYDERSSRAADEGTRIHALIDDMLTGKKTPSDERETLLLQDILSVAKDHGCKDVSEAELERTFYLWYEHGVAYGGTRDFRFARPDGLVLYLDWKTVVRARELRIDELAQIAAYQGEENLGHPAADVYVSQETLRVSEVRVWTPEELRFGWDYFNIAYKVMRMTDQFAEMQR